MRRSRTQHLPQISALCQRSLSTTTNQLESVNGSVSYLTYLVSTSSIVPVKQERYNEIEYPNRNFGFVRPFLIRWMISTPRTLWTMLVAESD